MTVDAGCEELVKVLGAFAREADSADWVGWQLIGFGWKARRDEPGREGTLQHPD
jgi:hypothetical protein